MPVEFFCLVVGQIVGRSEAYVSLYSCHQGRSILSLLAIGHDVFVAGTERYRDLDSQQM